MQVVYSCFLRAGFKFGLCMCYSRNRAIANIVFANGPGARIHACTLLGTYKPHLKLARYEKCRRPSLHELHYFSKHNHMVYGSLKEKLILRE